MRESAIEAEEAETALAHMQGTTNQSQDEERLRERLRALPSVDELSRALQQRPAKSLGANIPMEGDGAGAPIPPGEATRIARLVLEQARSNIRSGAPAPTLAQLHVAASHRFTESAQPRLRPIINATGVVINTNLGRAPLSQAALREIGSVAAGYSNLEFDLERGERGSRQTAVRELLCELTGAEDAFVVNNNAAAVLLALTALAQSREVILSRGELVEIGGGFRVPDVMRQSGARLVEVGTTNRTRIADYAAAITNETGALLAVHPSNFRIIGFTEAATLRELAMLAHAHALPLIHDLGSGTLLPTERYGLAHEPIVHESLEAGVDLVCFSGDKLLGGPQAGILVGRRDLIVTISKHPLARALRIDKLSLAALEATLRAHREQNPTAIPIWRMIALTQDELSERAERWVARLREADVAASAIAGESTVGGGSLPGETLPTTLCVIAQESERGWLKHPKRIKVAPGALSVRDVAELAARLRHGDPPVVARVLHKRLLLDPRTVPSELDEILILAVIEAVKDVQGGERPGDLPHA